MDVKNVIVCAQLFVDTVLDSSSSSSEDDFIIKKKKYNRVNNFLETIDLYSEEKAIISKIVDWMVQIIAKEQIVFPNEEEMKNVSSEFEKISGFPNVVGCIDGSYIPIIKPKHKIRSTYINRHDTLSITLQGICDANLKFIDVFTGAPSRIHDSRVLKLSFINKELPRKCFPNYHLLGDSAYPLREYLLTPYKDYGNLTEGEKIYNKKFCATRVKIENAFGKLKGRFRQLLRLDFQNVKMMAKFVIACCAMHNLCIDNNDIHDDEEEGTTQHPEEINNCPDHSDTDLR